MSNFLPSVYAIADEALYNSAAHELIVTVSKAHGFAVSDVLRIITDSGKTEHTVSAVLGDNTFVISGVETAPTSRVFVFGKRGGRLSRGGLRPAVQHEHRGTQHLAAENQNLKARIVVLEQAV